MDKSWVGLALLGVVVLAGCSPEGRDAAGAPGFTVSDSAGVIIAYSQESAWASGSAWSISPQAIVTIGDSSGRGGTDFGAVRGAVRLSDGRIVVPDGLSRELRVFGSDGTFLTAFGGPGDGPGEFQLLDSRLGLLHGDSIAARDVGAYRSAIFAPDGTLGRTVSGPTIGWNGLSGVFVAGWLEDGSFVVGETPQPSDLLSGRSLVRQEWHYFDAEANHIGAIDRLPAYYANNEGDGRGPLALGPRAAVAAASHGFWHGFPETFELRYYGPNGLERVIRKEWQAEAIPERVRSIYRDYRTEVAEACVARIPPDFPAASRQRFAGVCQARLDQMIFADALPAFTRILPSRDGFLWVEEHPSAEELAEHNGDWSPQVVSSNRWSVFNSEGQWLGTVNAPPEVRILDVGSDYVLGVRVDDLDVPYVVLHELSRPDVR